MVLTSLRFGRKTLVLHEFDLWDLSSRDFLGLEQWSKRSTARAAPATRRQPFSRINHAFSAALVSSGRTGEARGARLRAGRMDAYVCTNP